MSDKSENILGILAGSRLRTPDNLVLDIPKNVSIGQNFSNLSAIAFKCKGDVADIQYSFNNQSWLTLSKGYQYYIDHVYKWSGTIWFKSDDDIQIEIEVWYAG